MHGELSQQMGLAYVLQMSSGMRTRSRTPSGRTGAPSWTINPRNGDAYAAYNKPAAVIDWLVHDEVTMWVSQHMAAVALALRAKSDYSRAYSMRPCR